MQKGLETAVGAACLRTHPEELLHQRKLPEALSSQPLPQLQAKCFHFFQDLMPRKYLWLRDTPWRVFL